MSDVAVVGIAIMATIVVVVLCATFRPSATSGLVNALNALAAVFAAAWPWKR